MLVELVEVLVDVENDVVVEVDCDVEVLLVLVDCEVEVELVDVDCEVEVVVCIVVLSYLSSNQVSYPSEYHVEPIEYLWTPLAYPAAISIIK